ncbi:MAG: hypothetical protein ABFR95_02945 [Actinomycetota bacterium]
MTIPEPTEAVQEEIRAVITANGHAFAMWLNGELGTDQIGTLTDLFTSDALMANARLPGMVAPYEAFGSLMDSWKGLYAHDPVRSSVEIKSILEVGDGVYLTVHVRHLESSSATSSSPETTLFVRDPDSGVLRIRVIAE